MDNTTEKIEKTKAEYFVLKSREHFNLFRFKCIILGNHFYSPKFKHKLEADFLIYVSLFLTITAKFSLHHGSTSSILLFFLAMCCCFSSFLSGINKKTVCMMEESFLINLPLE